MAPTSKDWPLPQAMSSCVLPTGGAISSDFRSVPIAAGACFVDRVLSAQGGDDLTELTGQFVGGAEIWTLSNREIDIGLTIVIGFVRLSAGKAHWVWA